MMQSRGFRRRPRDEVAECSLEDVNDLVKFGPMTNASIGVAGELLGSTRPGGSSKACLVGVQVFGVGVCRDFRLLLETCIMWQNSQSWPLRHPRFEKQ